MGLKHGPTPKPGIPNMGLILHARFLHAATAPLSCHEASHCALLHSVLLTVYSLFPPSFSLFRFRGLFPFSLKKWGFFCAPHFVHSAVVVCSALLLGAGPGACFRLSQRGKFACTGSLPRCFWGFVLPVLRWWFFRAFSVRRSVCLSYFLLRASWFVFVAQIFALFFRAIFVVVFRPVSSVSSGFRGAEFFSLGFAFPPSQYVFT